jgi:proteic killer suppression protein
MDCEFGSDDLKRLYMDPSFEMGLPSGVVKAYRKRVWFISSAADERDLRAWRGLHMEKLSGDREGEYSIRLNDQFRMIFELIGEGSDKRLRIVGVVDYH